MAYTTIFFQSQIEKLRSFAFFAGLNIYTGYHKTTDTKYGRIGQQSALKLLSNTIKITGIISISSAIPASFSIYALLIKHEILMPVPVLFPFTDPETINGIILNFLNQLFVGIVGFTGSIGIEMTTILIKNSVWTMAVATCYAIDELVEKMTQSASKVRVDYVFRNILLQSQDIDRHVQAQKNGSQNHTY